MFRSVGYILSPVWSNLVVWVNIFYFLWHVDFQGRDKDCILVSFVRSSDNSRACTSSLLGDWHRINVALTRAKVTFVWSLSPFNLKHYNLYLLQLHICNASLRGDFESPVFYLLIETRMLMEENTHVLSLADFSCVLMVSPLIIRLYEISNAFCMLVCLWYT